MLRSSTTSVALLLISSLLVIDCTLRANDFTVSIPRVSRPPKLEDFINGSEREAELEITDFRQFDPGDGDPVSQPTTAYLSYDDENLYVAFVCKDDADKIRATRAKRENILADDRVTINIDTFHDHRRAYFFDVNPYGVQMDGITTDITDDFSFDTLWYSEGQITSDGYVVLETIPFKSLRFPNKPEQTWGIILARFIQRNNEIAMWPYVTRRLLPQWIPQFGHLAGIERISPGRNMQFIPYGLFSRARFLDTPVSGLPQFRAENEARVGLDAKMVLRDALTLDLAVNPDFSQVESDEPQVTINQRYEVYFPEKRPLFIENAAFFNTPENLFFSRRIADPQFGVRLTGKVGRWALGALAADDRAPGRRVAPSDPLYGRRSGIGVFRLQREFAQDSHIGGLVTSQDFASSSNRVFSLDARVKLKPNWLLEGQAISSHTRQLDGSQLSGPAYFVGLRHGGRHLSYRSSYTDRSPHFRSQLGFIPRVDIREMDHRFGYRWRPERRTLVSFGPSLTALVNWDRQGRVRDWEVEPEFSLELPRLTELGVERSEAFELFENLGFRKGHSRVYLRTEWLKWLALSSSYSQGTNINFYPAWGLTPFLADSSYGSLELTLRPRPQIRLDQTYIYSRLDTPNGWKPTEDFNQSTIFNNHIIRSKLNYQFSREFSLRIICDYNAVLPDPSLVSLERSKRLGADVLFTYLLHPGTALYVGYTDVYENLALDPTLSPRLYRTVSPGTSIGRQFFVKVSYLFRM